MRFLQKIKQKIFFFVHGILFRKEPRIIEKSEAADSVLHLIHVLHEQNVDRVLLICSKQFEKTDFFTKLKERFHGSDLKIVVYSEQVKNPSVTLVEQCVHLFFSNNCQAIVAIGGNSIIDLAKATKARILRPEKSIHKLYGTGKIKSGYQASPVLVTCPTTITSTESAMTTWIMDHTNHTKYLLADKSLQPNFVIHCAEYVSLSPNQHLIATSIGTLGQAFESLVSTNHSKYIQQNANESISLILNTLNKKDEAISDLQTAALKGKTANKKTLDKLCISDLQTAAFKTGIASGRSMTGYVTAIANAFAVYFNLSYSEVSVAALPLVLEAYTNLKPELVSEINASIKIQNLPTTLSEKNPVKLRQAYLNAIPELIEYIKHDVGSFHSPPISLSDDQINNILTSLIG